MVKRKKKLPTKGDIINLLTELEGQPAQKREIAKFFNIKGAEPRIALRELLRDMENDGEIEYVKGKRYRIPAGKGNGNVTTPAIIRLRVAGITDDGELFCEAAEHNEQDKYPLIILDTKTSTEVGDFVNASLVETGVNEYLATAIKTVEEAKHPTLMGMYKQHPKFGAIFAALDKKLGGTNFNVKNPPKDLKDGNIVLAKVLGPQEKGSTPVEIIKIVSDDIKGQEVAIAISNYELPHVFPDEVIAESEKLKPVTEAEKNKRADLRKLPFVTIDGADAKDFDDAVWAEPWLESDGNGHHIIVAIADVAHYVTEHSELDIHAQHRGNSVYLPGTVIPMLPEKISNNLCSLVPHEDRPVLAVHIWIDSNGKLKKHEFVRAVIHSHARLTYEQVQLALDGKDICDEIKPTSGSKGLMEQTIIPLFNAYKSLIKARDKRGALDLDIPETYIDLAEDAHIKAIKKRDRLDSHKLIEEMMVLANVAAATALLSISAPCLYRIHPEPGKTKLDNLKLALKGFDINLSISGGITPLNIQNVINKNSDRDDAQSLHMMVLRSQEQARYDEENIGHFGLALQKYAHFTSPIRRYSDLIVHRSLVANLKLYSKTKVNSPTGLSQIAEHLGITERRAQQAEWEVKDRLTTRFYTDFVGKEFEAKVVTVATFGMFVSIDEGIAEGLLPMRTMTDDYYIFDEKNNSLRGRKNRKKYTLGSVLKVKLSEADVVTGRLTFTPVDFDEEKANSRRKPQRTGGGFSPKKSDKKKVNKSYKNKPKK